MMRIWAAENGSFLEQMLSAAADKPIGMDVDDLDDDELADVDPDNSRPEADAEDKLAEWRTVELDRFHKFGVWSKFKKNEDLGRDTWGSEVGVLLGPP